MGSEETDESYPNPKLEFVVSWRNRHVCGQLHNIETKMTHTM